MNLSNMLLKIHSKNILVQTILNTSIILQLDDKKKRMGQEIETCQWLEGKLSKKK